MDQGVGQTDQVPMFISTGSFLRVSSAPQGRFSVLSWYRGILSSQHRSCQRYNSTRSPAFYTRLVTRSAVRSTMCCLVTSISASRSCVAFRRDARSVLCSIPTHAALMLYGSGRSLKHYGFARTLPQRLGG